MRTVLRRALVIGVALAAALSIPATAATDHPIFVTAAAGTTGAWTGYTATVQVRPDTTGMYVWPGGYLADGTFVQNGMLMPGSPFTQPGEARLFAWATTNTGDSELGPFPLAWVSIPNARLYSWWTFQLVRRADHWTFRYRDPAGLWHRQGSFTSRAALDVFTVNAEYWASGPVRFGTQVVRKALVRVGSRWVLASMAHGPPSDQVGREEITSACPGNAVFRSVSGPRVFYRVLW
jgi:hypothetical protein